MGGLLKNAMATVVLTIASVLLAGCATLDRTTGQGWSSYPPGTIVDYQLGAAYPPPAGVGGVARDSTDRPAPGLYNICYVNGFQTQPGSANDWLAERRRLVLTGDDGVPLIDPNWPDELILDTSTPQRRADILATIGLAITRCAASGFNAVEIDNLDSYTRSEGKLTLDDAVALATGYAELAHSLGLAIAQKNTADLGRDRVDEIGFDFVIAEECHLFDECAAYRRVYGDAVIDIEYSDVLRGPFEAACDDPDAAASTILRDRGLGAPDDPAYVFDRC